MVVYRPKARYGQVTSPGEYIRLAQEPDGSLPSRITDLRLRPEGLKPPADR